MPYIKKEDRQSYDELIKKLAEKVDAWTIDNGSPAGQLNYIITKLILSVYGPHLPSYINFNEIVGILECAKLEMYRHHVGPYEDKKINENGDV